MLGTALIYRRHQTGVHRAFSELLRQFFLHREVSLEFVSAGRAVWLEFPSHIAFDRHWKRDGWSFRIRRARLPGSYSLFMIVARAGLFAREMGWLTESMLAGFFQILGWGLRGDLAGFSAGVYYSPAHALPGLPENVSRCITLYDMIPVKFPEWYDESEGFRKILRSINPEKDRVATISECSRKDLLEYSAIPPNHVKVIPCGVSESFFPRRDAAGIRCIREKYSLGEARFVLAVGTLEPRKNLGILVRAFLDLQAQEAFRDVVLLLAGPRGWKNDSLFQLLRSQSENAHAIHFAGFVPDADLPWLYSACELFAFSSLYEGFGLPVAEALKCGAAVLCGNHSSLPEVGGDAVEYVDVRSSDEVKKALETLLSNGDKLKVLREKAVRRSRIFNWEDAANAYLKLFYSLTS